MAQDAVAVFAHGRARRLHHDAFGKEDRLVGQNERALSLPESHTHRISAPSRNSWQGDAILPLCEPGDRAMWIVMCVAMIASLSAMGCCRRRSTGTNCRTTTRNRPASGG